MCNLNLTNTKKEIGARLFSIAVLLAYFETKPHNAGAKREQAAISESNEKKKDTTTVFECGGGFCFCLVFSIFIAKILFIFFLNLNRSARYLCVDERTC